MIWRKLGGNYPAGKLYLLNLVYSMLFFYQIKKVNIISRSVRDECGDSKQSRRKRCKKVLNVPFC